MALVTVNVYDGDALIVSWLVPFTELKTFARMLTAEESGRITDPAQLRYEVVTDGAPTRVTWAAVLVPAADLATVSICILALSSMLTPTAGTVTMRIRGRWIAA